MFCRLRGDLSRFGKIGSGADVRATDQNVSTGRVGPASVVVEARKRADGVEDGGGSDFDLARLLDEIFDDGADVLAAGHVEGGGAGVAVKGVRVVDLEEAADIVCAVPPEIGAFDFIEGGMAAERAFAAVTFEGRVGGAAFGDFGFGSAGEASAKRRGDFLRAGALALCGFDFIFAEPGKIFRVLRRKSLGGALCGAAGGDGFVETTGEHYFGWAIAAGHGLSPLQLLNLVVS